MQGITGGIRNKATSSNSDRVKVQREVLRETGSTSLEFMIAQSLYRINVRDDREVRVILGFNLTGDLVC